ncbi:MAG: PASTA domain-containing protein [Prolixibacteraceae bacterium]
MTLKEFLKSKPFKLNALAALGIIIFLILFILLGIRIYTDHGHTIEIPDLKGKNSQEANTLLDDLDLRVEIRDSVYSTETLPGTVLDQFPKPGMKVKKNRTVFITLCAVNQEMIAMPQLTDISFRQAINLIESTGLISGKIEYKPSEFPNLVLEQKINGMLVPEGELIPKGSVVDLVLGSNSDGQTSEVPTLFGRNQAEAKLALEEAFLILGTVTYDDSLMTDNNKEKALIWKQSPDPAEVFEVPVGTPVDIWLTNDPQKLQAKPQTTEPENSFF